MKQRTAKIRLVASSTPSLREPTFPSWAPGDVVARWREETRAAAERLRSYDEWAAPMLRDSGEAVRRRAAADRAERLVEFESTARLLQRLLTDEERMRSVWEFLSKAGNYGAGEGIPHTSIFT